MKTLVRKLSLAFLLLLPFNAFAQFTLSGNEPGSLKWSEIETNTYRIIYPKGLDSLARSYAIELERAVEPVNYSSAFRINQSYRSKWPVVLHSYAAYSNGSVSWPPHRMELYTSPDAYAPEALPWQRMLGIHESRHIAQMQYGAAYPFTGWKYLLGEFSSGALAALYCGSSFFEGDAVVAETALSNSGRGRSADFLEYMRVSFAEGDMRDFNRWRYGSMNLYSPDYYKVSYVYYGGVRSYFNTPDFNKRYFETVNKYNGVAFFINNKMGKLVGGKNHDKLFLDIADSLATDWNKDELARAPFMPSRTIAGNNGKRYRDYHKLAYAGRNLYAVRKGITLPTQLVKISGDKVKTLGNFPSESSTPRYSPVTDKLYWSEYTPDLRWEMKSSSDIRYIDGKGRYKYLTRGKRYYNPAPAPTEAVLALAYYPDKGGSVSRILDSESGEAVASHPAPDGLQVVEFAWVGKELYASGLSNDGFGLYKVGKVYECVLAPQNVKIKQLWEHSGKIMFCSDRSGVNELYSFDPETKDLFQLSSTRFGAADFQFNEAADSLYYSSLTVEGRNICVTATKDLQPRKVDSGYIAVFPMADELSAQEAVKINDGEEIAISEPADYRKLPHAFRFHSWLPFFFDYDNISNISFSNIHTGLGLGATVFTQNTLGTLSGYASYQARPETGKAWRHSGVVNLTYSGLYPVLEAKLNINRSNAYDYVLGATSSGQPGLMFMSDNRTGISAGLRAYVPLNFSGGGWQRGLIPSIGYNFTNDRFLAMNGEQRYISKANVSVRGYIMENTPSSRVFPRLGIGAEIGLGARTEIANLIGPTAYAFIYGYLPGLHELQGMKLSAMFQKQFKDACFNEAFVNVIPRGFTNSSIISLLAEYPLSSKFSMDYAIAFCPIEWYAFGLVYLRNLELTPNFDFSLFSGKGYRTNTLWSAGADLVVRIETLGSSPVRVGLSYDYLGGSLYPIMNEAGYTSRPHSINLVLNADF